MFRRWLRAKQGREPAATHRIGPPELKERKTNIAKGHRFVEEAQANGDTNWLGCWNERK